MCRNHGGLQNLTTLQTAMVPEYLCLNPYMDTDLSTENISE